MRKLNIIFALLLLPLAMMADKKEIHIPMDYSSCGYKASRQALPMMNGAIRVDWHDGDMSATIQAAIDQLSSAKPDKQGFRGAVLLGEGTFRLDKPLRIKASGIVLRGTHKDRTILLKHGADRGAVVYIEASPGSQPFSAEGTKQDTLLITDAQVSAGASTLTLSAPLAVGSRIAIVRPSTKEWIEQMGCADFGGNLSYTGWKPGDIDLTWYRTVTAVSGTTVTLDAPLTCSISKDREQAYIITDRTYDSWLTEVGVENLTIEAAITSGNPKDEDHAWDGIWMENVRDAWVSAVNFRHLAGSAVNLQRHTQRITVQDCVASEPVSEIGGWRRCVFTTRGQQTLFQRCISREGIHDFSAGYCAAGPNAFVQCEGEQSLGFSGSIGAWAPGLLFDIVNIEGHDLSARNLEQFAAGTGWNTANTMFWQCTASTIWNYSPDDDNRNSAHGCWATMTGNGEWGTPNAHVQPRSLFYSQLSASQPSATEATVSATEATVSGSSSAGVNAWLLPRATNASSSPTVEEAMALAQETLDYPRLTMEMWLDTIYTATQWPSAEKVKAQRYIAPEAAATLPEYSVENGKLIMKAAGPPVLLTGNRHAIPWWNGRTKDKNAAKAKPALTRHVPGLEGNGWTDRIDSVITWMKNWHYVMLDHNYGLWYDLRRTDHERVKRADGDAWAPFYEQPFARSGEGKGWDGLSLYDLTKPNKWYWERLSDFARKAAPEGILLFHENYFQHNILEAGAHWVDCPWRAVNNINGTSFPEPVPFTGDKRLFLAEQFYDETDAANRPLHEGYIRMCLDQLKDEPNVVHLISEEYTGPTHFLRFWLQTIAKWEAETGCHPLIALSACKDAQDEILADKELSKVVDIIDIRYWHYNTNELWAPESGKNLSPRQHMRKWKAGATNFPEVYRAVSEYTSQYPDKAVTYYGQSYDRYGWAVLMAGGSCPNIPVTDKAFLADAATMRPSADAPAGWLSISSAKGSILYPAEGKDATISLAGKKAYTVNPRTGEISAVKSGKTLTLSSDKVYWVK